MPVSRAWSKLLPLGIGLIVLFTAGAVGFLRQQGPGEGQSGAVQRDDGSMDSQETLPQASAPLAPSGLPGREARRTEVAAPRAPRDGTPASPGSGRTASAAEARATRLDKLRSQVLDEKLDPALRIRELESLHQVGGITPKVTEGMLKLLSKTDDDRLRSKILRGLRGDSSEAFKFESLSRLTQDPSPMVRKAAAGALQDFRSDPLIANALQNSSRSDPDPSVRRESEESLTRPTEAPGAHKPFDK